MFDRISLNVQMLDSRFDQTRNQGAHTAPEANSARQRMKIHTASFLLKSGLLFCNESGDGNRVEHSAHIFWGECSTQWSSAQYLCTNIYPDYHLPHRLGCG